MQLEFPVPTRLSAITQQEYQIYGCNPAIIIEVEVLFEVCADWVGCPSAEQRTEYRVIGAGAGTVGEGWDQTIARDEEVMSDTLTL